MKNSLESLANKAKDHEVYVLERREPFVMQNILGNTSQPVYTYRWKEIAIAEKKEDLEAIKPKDNPHFQYRIEERFMNLKR